MTALSRSALALLLRIVNSPNVTIAAEGLAREGVWVANELVEGGFLKPAGCLEYLPREDGGFHELVWCSALRAYRYFCVDAGWTTEDNKQLKRYRVDSDGLLNWLTQLFDIGARYRVSNLSESVFWYLGVSRFGRYRVHWYFVRRLEDSHSLRLFLTALKRESSRSPVIIASASTFIPPTMVLALGQVMVPLGHLLSRNGDQCMLDSAVVQSLLRDAPTNTNEVCEGGIGLRFSADYRQAHWNGEAYPLTKKQAAVVEALDQQGGRAHKDLLRAAANSNEKLSRITSNRIDGQWVAHPLWGELIKSQGNGYYYLDRG